MTGTREIPLTQGFVALVDEIDFALLAGVNWYVQITKRRVTALGREYGTGRLIYMHRLILGLSPGDPGVDHINGNALDNRRTNLRLATGTQQNANQRKRRDAITSQHKGVSISHGKWTAQIMVNGKNRVIGYFGTELEAAEAYKQEAKESFGEYAYNK